MTFCSPCIDCNKKIKEMGIKKIIYVDDNKDLIKTKSSDYVATQLTSGRRFINKKQNID